MVIDSLQATTNDNQITSTDQVQEEQKSGPSVFNPSDSEGL